MSEAANVVRGRRASKAAEDDEASSKSVVRRAGATQDSFRTVSVRPLGETRMRSVANHAESQKLHRSKVDVHADALASMSVTNAASVATLEGLVRTCKTTGCDPAEVQKLTSAILTHLIPEIESMHTSSKSHLATLIADFPLTPMEVTYTSKELGVEWEV